MHVSVGASEGYFLSKLMTIYFTEGDLCMFKKGSNSVPKLGSQRAKNKYQKCPPFRVPKIVRNMVRKLTKNGPKLVQKWCRFWFPKLEPKSDFGHVFGTTFPARPDKFFRPGRTGKSRPAGAEKLGRKNGKKWFQKRAQKLPELQNFDPKFGTKTGPRFGYQK